MVAGGAGAGIMAALLVGVGRNPSAGLVVVASLVSPMV